MNKCYGVRKTDVSRWTPSFLFDGSIQDRLIARCVDAVSFGVDRSAFVLIVGFAQDIINFLNYLRAILLVNAKNI